MGEERSKVAFFDLEVQTLPGYGTAILEFGAILVCPMTLVELEEPYSILVRPTDQTYISTLSVRSNGITPDAVTSARTFSEIADKVYDILHGRIWAGHNIVEFDWHLINDAFAGINRPAPVPNGIIDTLALLRQRFGRRAGDMKMDSLAHYFGLGPQTHRSLDDVRMNLEVLKCCATVLLLESSLPTIFTENSLVSSKAITRRRSSCRAIAEESCFSTNAPSPSVMIHPFNMDKFEESLQSDDMETESGSYFPESPTSTETESFIGCTDFLEPNEISIPSISVSLAPFYRGSQKIIKVLHDYGELQVCCRQMKVQLGIRKKYLDKAGWPQLSFVVDASSHLCQILDAVDNRAQKLSVDSGSRSEWRRVVTRKPGFMNYPTVRLKLPTVVDGNVFRWETEIYIYQKESPTTQKLNFSRFDVEELQNLITPGTLVDAYFSVYSYDFQQYAGIRLVAKKLIVHPT